MNVFRVDGLLATRSIPLFGFSTLPEPRKTKTNKKLNMRRTILLPLFCRVLCITLLCCILSPTVQSQEWVRTLESSFVISSPGVSRVVQVIKTADGGCASIGSTNSFGGTVAATGHGNYDLWVVKYDAVGTVEWQKLFGGSEEDRGYSVYQTSDNGFVVVGYTKSDDGDVTDNHGQSDIWLIRLDSDGNLLWQKTFGADGEDYGKSIIQTSEGGYALLVQFSKKILTIPSNLGTFWTTQSQAIKLNASGGIEWTHVITEMNSAPGLDPDHFIFQTSDKGLAVATGKPMLLTRLSATGQRLWVAGPKNYRTYPVGHTGVIRSWTSSLFGAAQTKDGSFVLSGWTYATDPGYGEGTVMITMINSLGTVMWQDDADLGRAGLACETAEGGVIVNGPSGLRKYTADGTRLSTSPGIGGPVTELPGGEFVTGLPRGISKYSASGNLEWQTALIGNSMLSQREQFNDLSTTGDGGYIAVGTATSIDAEELSIDDDSNLIIVKMEADGQQSWQKNLGGMGREGGEGIIQTTDGGYAFVGFKTVTTSAHQSDVWVGKINQDGNPLWDISIGGTGLDVGQSIVQTSDGGFLIVGNSTSNDGDVTGNHGGYDALVIKLTANGAVEWKKMIGTLHTEMVNEVVEVADGFVLVGKWYEGPYVIYAIPNQWIVKLNAVGTLLWQRTEKRGEIKDIVPHADGTLLVAGAIGGMQGPDDFYISKINADGSVAWEKILAGNSVDIINSLTETTAGEILAVGLTYSTGGDVKISKGGGDVWAARFSSNGDLISQRVFGGTRSDYATAAQSSDGQLVFAGYSMSVDDDFQQNKKKQTTAFIARICSQSIVVDNVATTVCAGQPIAFSVSGAASYVWDDGSTNANISFVPANDGQMAVKGTLADGCVEKLVFRYIVNPLPTLSLKASGEKTTICEGSRIRLYANGGAGYDWSANGLPIPSNPFPFNSSLEVSPNVTTVYSVSSFVGGGNDCRASASITIEVNPTTILPITGPFVVIPGKELTYSAPSTPSVLYFWSMDDGRGYNNGTIVSGQYTNQVTVKWDLFDIGYIRLGASVGDCTGNSFLQVIRDPVSEVGEDPIDHPILFPNPTDGVLYIEINDQGDYSAVDIVNMLGVAVSTIQVDKVHRLSLETEALPAGIYFAVLKGPTSRRLRFVKE